MTTERFRGRFASVMSELLLKYQCSIYTLEKVYGIVVRDSIKAKQDFTRDSVRRIIAALRIPTEEGEEVWRAYIGKDPEGMRELLQAHLRRYGYDDVAACSGSSTGALQQILRGKRRPRGIKHTPPQMPSWTVWRKIAQALGLEENAARDLWRTGMHRFWIEQHKENPLSAEVRTLCAEYAISSNDWIKWNYQQRPAAFAKMNRRQLAALMSALRQGTVVPWVVLQMFCDALTLPDDRRRALLDAVGRTVLQGEGRLAPYRTFHYWPQWERQLLTVVIEAYTAGEDPRAALDPAIARLSAIAAPLRSGAAHTVLDL